MKQSKDPFEAAAAYEEEQEEEEEQKEQSSPDSPITRLLHFETQTPAPPPSQEDVAAPIAQDDDQVIASSEPSTYMPPRTKPKNKDDEAAAAADDDDEDDDDNMDVDELSKLPSSADPDKMAKMQTILCQFTEDQMSRYESFRRSALQKSNMKRLLVSITGSQKVSLPMTIVVCGIAKMFVGELVEAARTVMTERKDSGPIRPCHIREAYRRLKLEGKLPKRSVPRLFR